MLVLIWVNKKEFQLKYNEKDPSVYKYLMFLL